MYKYLGLLLLRLGIGGSMIAFHGYGKLVGGPEVWEKIGSNMHYLGIDMMPMVWGLMAALAEFLGSLLIMFGVLFRPAALALAFTMAVAVCRHLSLPAGMAGAGWSAASHAMELFFVYVALFLIGPGKYRIPRW
jgi:putative oxidoreductase